MAVTLTTAAHSAEQWKGRKASTAEDLFKESCPYDHHQSKRILRHSVTNNSLETSHISPSEHGFVWSVVHAYSHHHHLTIRPEDVWFSILTQLSVFINRHSEEVRASFVAHEGQKELEVKGLGSIHTADFGSLAVLLTRKIEENVLDEELRDWIMPIFTTTTTLDVVIAAITMMGAMQKFFFYRMMLLCGIPSVTLLGEREDWVALTEKLDKLQTLADEPARFAQLLRPILNYFVASFDNPESPDVLDFWSRCAHRQPGGSGPSYLSGWVSVFCFWDDKGDLMNLEKVHERSSPEFEAQNTALDLQDVLSRKVNIDQIPSGIASVPVTVNDNGIDYKTVMVAGLVGIQASSCEARDDTGPAERAIDSIRPLSGWFMYEKKNLEDF